MNSKNNIFGILLVLFQVFLLSCADDLEDRRPVTETAGCAMTLSFVSDRMLPQQVATRSSDPKDDEEKKINSLYIFYFDTDGNYLTGVDGFNGYNSNVIGQTTVNVDRKNLKEGITVFAVANVEPTTFQVLDEAGRPQKIANLEALENFVYHPDQLTLGLPLHGMPMTGKKVLTAADVLKNNVMVELKALMARIDVNIRLASETTDNDLPGLMMESWTAVNVPTEVCFKAPENGKTTPALENHKLSEKEATVSLPQAIYNNNGSISFSYYMFENVQQKVSDYSYPPGVKEWEKQRYKPLIADKENAAAVQLRAYYSTYNEHGNGSSTYDVTYTLYLGANYTDDFQVRRNHQYKNDITIKGITNAGSDPEHITLDTRVNVTDSNPYFVSILRERDHDAHFNVTPMDVYFFNADKHPSMAVTLVPDKDGKLPDWIRMERVSASDMESGTAPVGTLPNGESVYLATGKPWHAGNGKRRYFTTNLLTTTLKDHTAYTLHSRDRIYFYIDENLSTADRSATVEMTYRDDDGEAPPKMLLITQHGLKKVLVRGDDRNAGQTIYIEAYEEYLQHYDPLDAYQTDQIYSGLEWGLYKQSLAYWDTWANVYYNGLEATNYIISKSGQDKMSLNDKPRSAAEYCYNKNKRNDDGSVSNAKWFLPGIRQLESILTTYYSQYPEFQQNFYWSSAAGKLKWGLLYYEDSEYARATKARADGTYISSAENDIYTGEDGNGGKASRTGTYLRIRAARMDLNP